MKVQNKRIEITMDANVDLENSHHRFELFANDYFGFDDEPILGILADEYTKRSEVPRADWVNPTRFSNFIKGRAIRISIVVRTVDGKFVNARNFFELGNFVDGRIVKELDQLPCEVVNAPVGYVHTLPNWGETANCDYGKLELFYLTDVDMAKTALQSSMVIDSMFGFNVLSVDISSFDGSFDEYGAYDPNELWENIEPILCFQAAEYDAVDTFMASLSATQ